jgi:thiol-disulfide isomerase/thioredoxin
VRRWPLLLTAILWGCASTPATEPVDPAVAVPVAPSEGGPDYVTLGASAVDPADYGVGKAVPAFSYSSATSEDSGTLDALLKDSKGVVVVFSTLGCPVCKLYHPSLERLAQRYADSGLRFLVVDPAIQDSETKLVAKAGRMKWTFPLTRDLDYTITDALGAKRTTDVFLIDAQGVLRYRGALDDQYGIGYRLPAPRARYLEDAVQALLAGREIALPATVAAGCKLSRVKLRR